MHLVRLYADASRPVISDGYEFTTHNYKNSSLKLTESNRFFLSAGAFNSHLRTQL
jgi:hypothetical protein